MVQGKTHGLRAPTAQKGRFWPLLAKLCLAGWAAGGLAVGAAALWASDDARLTAAVQQQLRSRGLVQVRRVQWQAPWGLRLEGLRLQAPGTGAPALLVGTAAVDLAPSAVAGVLRRQVRLASLELDGVEAWLGGSTDPSGLQAVLASLAGDAEGPPSDAPSLWQLQLASLHVGNVRLSYAPADSSTFVALEGGQLRARLQLSQQRQSLHDLHASFAAATGRLPWAADPGASQGVQLLQPLGLSAAQLDHDTAPGGEHWALEGGTLQLADHDFALAIRGAGWREASDPNHPPTAKNAGAELVCRGPQMQAELQLQASLGARTDGLLQLLPPPLRRRLAASGGGELAFSGHHSGDWAAPGCAPAGAARLQLTPVGTNALQVAGLQLHHLAAQAHWQGGQVTAEDLQLAGNFGALRGRGTATLQGPGPQMGRHELYATFSELEPRLLARAAQQLSGGARAPLDLATLPTRVAGEITGQGVRLTPLPEGRYSLRLASACVPWLPPQALPCSLRLRVRAGPEALQVDELQLLGGRGTVTAEASAVVPWRADAPWSATFTARGPAVGSLAERHRWPVSAASVAVQGQLQGSRLLPDARLQLDVRGLRQRSAAVLGDFYAELRLHAGTLTLQPASLQGPHGHLHARGLVAQALDATGAYNPAGPLHLELNVGQLRIQLPAGNQVTLRGSVLVGGTLQAPTLSLWSTATPSPRLRRMADQAQSSAQQPAVWPLPQGVAYADASLQTVTLRALGATWNHGGRLVARGLWQPTLQRGAVQVQGRGLPLPSDQPPGGVAAATFPPLGAAPTGAFAAGPRGDLALTAEGSLAEMHAQAAVRSPALRLDATARFCDRGQSLAASANAEISLAELGHSFVAVQALAPAGQVKVSASAHGAVAAPNLQGLATATGWTLAGQPVAGGTAQLTLTTLAANSWRLALSGGGPHPEGAGKLQLDVIRAEPPAKASWQLALAVRELHAAAYWPPLRALGADLATTLDATAQLGAAGPQAKIHVERLAALSQGGALALLAPMTVFVRGQEVLLPHFVLRGSAGEFSGRGEFGRNVQATLQGHLDLASVAPLVPALNLATGKVALSAQVHGNAAAPTLQASLRVQDPLALRLRAAPIEIKVRRGEARLSRHALLLHNFVGELDGGPFRLAGEVDLDAEGAPSRYDIAFYGDHLPLHLSALLVETNVDMALRGHGKYPNVVGRIDVLGGRFVKKLELRNFNFVRSTPVTAAPLAQSAPWLREVGLNVHVKGSNGLDVRLDAGAFAVQTRLESDLHVTGNALAPRLSGKVQALHAQPGSLRFPRAQLQLSQAAIDFEPSRASAKNRFGTEVLLLAAGEVGTKTGPGGQNYDVAVRLDGSLDDLHLDLSSPQPLTRLEVLTLLTTGHVHFADFAAGSGDATPLDAAIAFAGSQLSEPLARFAQQKIEQALNLRLEVGAEVSAGSVRVQAAKNVNKRLRVVGNYSHGLTSEQSTISTRAQLSLTERLLLEGQSARELTGASSAVGNPSSSKLQLKLRLFGR